MASRNPWVAKWFVSSHSNPDKEYTVAVRRDGTWGCSCPRWKFRRADLPNGHCKHIDYLRSRMLQSGGDLESFGLQPDEISASRKDQEAWKRILHETAAMDTAIVQEKISSLVVNKHIALSRSVRTRAGFIEF